MVRLLHCIYLQTWHFTADQILNSTLSTTAVTTQGLADGVTNVNDINSIRNQGMVPGGFLSIEDSQILTLGS